MFLRGFKSYDFIKGKNNSRRVLLYTSKLNICFKLFYYLLYTNYMVIKTTDGFGKYF